MSGQREALPDALIRVSDEDCKVLIGAIVRGSDALRRSDVAGAAAVDAACRRVIGDMYALGGRPELELAIRAVRLLERHHADVAAALRAYEPPRGSTRTKRDELAELAGLLDG